MNLRRGKTVHFRLVELSDANFIHSLRTDLTFNKHLSVVTGAVKDQEKWLLNYKEREKNNAEYYFIICRNDNDESVGSVRLYDFKGGKDSFCWGSWILNENKTKSAAIESALLVYDLAFNKLNFKSCHFDVRNANDKVIDFHLKMGAVQTGKNEIDSFFIYSPKSYQQFYEKYSKFLEQRL